MEKVIKMNMKFYLMKLYSILAISTCLSLSAAEISEQHSELRNEALQAVFNEVDKPDMLLSRLSFYLGLLYNRNDKQGRLVAQHADNRAIALSSDGKYCAFVSDGYLNDFEIKIYDTGTGALVKSFVPSNQVDCLAFSPDGKFLLSGGVNGRIDVWNFITGKLVRNHAFPFLWISGCDRFHKFSPDCRSVLVSNGAALTECWDFNSGVFINTKSIVEGALTAADFALPGQLIVSNYSKACLWDMAKKQQISSFFALVPTIGDLTYGNNMIAASYTDATQRCISIWETKEHKLLRILPQGNGKGPIYCYFISDVFLAIDDPFTENGVDIYDVITGRRVQGLPCGTLLPGSCNHHVTIAADKYSQIAIVDFHNKVRIFNSLPDNIRQKLHSLSFDQLLILTEIVAPLAQGRVIRLTPNSSAWNLVSQMPPEIRALVEPCLH